MTQLPSDLIEADFLRELKAIEAESMGWQPLEAGVWLHAGNAQATEVLVVGVPDVRLADQAVLLAGY